MECPIMVSQAIKVESPKSYGPPHPWTILRKQLQAENSERQQFLPTSHCAGIAPGFGALHLKLALLLPFKPTDGLASAGDDPPCSAFSTSDCVSE
jgi:hypothetical protein